MKEFDRRDESRMYECLRLARRGEGYVSPNPMVGALLVKRNEIVARGWHRKFDGPHAEIECLNRFKGDPRRSTLYVNLEPCSHTGKTPPCTDRIIDSGVKRVIIGIKDPNPAVSGRGIRALKRAGIEVRVGLAEDACRDLNQHFLKHIVSGLPFVHMKIAQTLNGKITGPHGWISSLSSRKLVHRWRTTHDAVLVGARTVIADNPRLDVRLTFGRNPDVLVLDGRLRTSPSALMYQPSPRRRRLVFCSPKAVEQKARKVKQLQDQGVEVVALAARQGRIPLRTLCRSIYRRSIGSILVEGGSELFGAFLSSGLVDRLSLFLSPHIAGKGIRTFSLSELDPRPVRQNMKLIDTAKMDKDLLLTYHTT